LAGLSAGANEQPIATMNRARVNNNGIWFQRAFFFIGFAKHRPIYRPKLPNVSQRVLHCD
jgi:hypothetical protein